MKNPNLHPRFLRFLESKLADPGWPYILPRDDNQYHAAPAANAKWREAAALMLMTGRAHGIRKRDSVIVPGAPVPAAILTDYPWPTKIRLSDTHAHQPTDA